MGDLVLKTRAPYLVKDHDRYREDGCGASCHDRDQETKDDDERIHGPSEGDTSRGLQDAGECGRGHGFRKKRIGTGFHGLHHVRVRPREASCEHNDRPGSPALGDFYDFQSRGRCPEFVVDGDSAARRLDARRIGYNEVHRDAVHAAGSHNLQG